MSDELKTLREAKAAAEKLSERERELREQHAALGKERRSVVAAYLPIEEVIANAGSLVDQAATSWMSKFGGSVVRALSGYRELRAPGDTSEREVKPHLPRIGDGNLTIVDLAGIAPALVKERLAEIIRATPSKFGLSADARAARLAEIDARIADLEAAHSELVDAAAEFGISLPLLDAVRERREADARRAAREQELAADRAKGIYRVEGASAQGGRPA